MRSEVNKIRLTVLIAMMFSALCAGVFRTPPILFMAALLCSAPLVAWGFARISGRGLAIARTLPESGTVGDVVSGEITLSNAARWPVFFVRAFCGDSQGGKAIAPVGDEEQVSPLLRPGRTLTHPQQWLLRRRGVHTLAPARVGVLDPLGFSTRASRQTPPHQIVVLPRPVRIEKIRFWGGAGLEQHASHHSTLVADAMDFHGVRPWQPGEAIRRAHWKHTARSGQLHVIEWEETPASDAAIFLDVHAMPIAGDEDENTLEAAITAAASIAAYLLENGCRFQLFCFAPEPDGTLRLRVLDAHSIQGLDKILRALAEAIPISDARADLRHLVEQASPLVARGMSTLLLASSRAEVSSALSLARRDAADLPRAFVMDADSFAVREASAPASTIPHAGTTPSRTSEGALHSRDRVWRFKRGETLSAALEGW